LLTSLNEGTPVSLIEAMASGTPVIATDVGAVRDLMGQEQEQESGGFRIMENGILVHAGDAGAMAAALCHVRDHQESFRSMAGKNRSAVIRRYGVQRAVEEHSAIYRSLSSPLSSS
jgi:glycosyltransferase involved in cell wall biosynthesis